MKNQGKTKVVSDADIKEIKYSVEVDISIGDETITTYLSVEAFNKEEAYKKAIEIVNSSLEVRIETKPVEEI